MDICVSNENYQIDQSMITIFDMKKIFGGEAKYYPRDSA